MDIVNTINPSFSSQMDKEARTVIITMPDSESTLLVLRCAYNEIAGKMLDSDKNQELYVKYADAIQKLMSIGKLNLFNLTISSCNF